MPRQQDASSARARDIAIFRSLLRLTDGYEHFPDERSEKSASIHQQWGTDKMFAQRVLWNIYPEKYPDKKDKLPSLDLDKLVEILTALKNYHSKQPLESRKNITRVEIVKIIRSFSQLSPDQESGLGLHANRSKILLQRLEDSINNLNPKSVSEVITKVYGYFLSTKLEPFNRQGFENKEEIIKSYLSDILNDDKKYDSNKVRKLKAKIEVEENKIKVENGIERWEKYNNKEIDPVHHLSASTMDILTKSVIENEVLTEKFPIYIKYIEVKKNRGLPLYLDRDINSYYLDEDSLVDNGVLNWDLHNSTEDNSIFSVGSLKGLFSYKVKVHFYIKILQKDLPHTNFDIDIHPEGDRYVVNFFEEITGVGSILAHVIAAINRVLLWDIPLLNEYIPIAKNIIITSEVLGSLHNNTIWGHNVVCLCKRADVKKSIVENKLYDEMFNTQSYACGDYCGFDILEVIAKSSFYARLRAIKQTGINPKQYIKECLNKISEVNSFRKAQSLLDNYPFSSLAMEKHIENNIFKTSVEKNEDHCQYKYRQILEKDNSIEFIELDVDWSMTAYEAHLAIAEATLKEGLYKKGKKYLDVLENHLKTAEGIKNKIDSLFIAKYYISRFRYYYLNPKGSMDNAADELKEAERYLKMYVDKCYAIDELPQVNFHDFFYIASSISSHKAKVEIFMNRDTRSEARTKSLENAIREFEKARIYAAKNGSVSMYSISSAYQSWCYTMAAYLGKEKNDRPDNLRKARKMLDHALVCYSENGRNCYERIKANAGKSKGYESYDDIQIQVISLIGEEETKPSKIYDADKNILTLDMSIFSWEYPDGFGRSNVSNTLLFGMPSAILLFALGIRCLCDDYNTPEVIFNEISRSISYFNYSWSIASEGLQLNEEKKEKSQGKIYNRSFQKKDGRQIKIEEQVIGSLYPHRMTQFADLGKIFAIVCYMIDLAYNKSVEEDITNGKINFLLNEIHENNRFNDKNIIEGQEQYNAHLKETIEAFEKYICEKRVEVALISESTTLSSKSSIIKFRDKIVRDIFYIITTRSSPVSDI